MNENNLSPDETPVQPEPSNEPHPAVAPPGPSEPFSIPSEETSPASETPASTPTNAPEAELKPIIVEQLSVPNPPVSLSQTTPPPAPTPRPATSITPYQPMAHPLTRRELLAWVSATALITLIMSILLTLGVLSAINGGLNFITPSQFSGLNRQVDGLNTQTKTLGTDLDGLRTRLDTLEGLSGRMDTVEKDAQSIHSQLDDSVKQAGQIQSSIAALNQSILDLQKNGQSFQVFLDGLRKLLTGSTQP